MIKPLAPRRLRGCSWLWVGILAALVSVEAFSSRAYSQNNEPGKKADAPPKKPAEKPEPAKAAEPTDKPATKSSSSVEVFKDPVAEEASAIATLKPLTGWKDIKNQGDINAIKAMASGGGFDRDALQRFVQAMGYRLTDKSNVQGWVEGVNPRKALEVQKASGLLQEVLSLAKSANNTAFLKVYNELLITNLSKLLKNHLLPRTEAIIVLAKTESPDAVPIFLTQLKDPEQTVWVKLCSAQGLSNVAGGGKLVDKTLGAQKAIDSGKVLADFILKNPDAPWPVLWRCVEAIGSMRQASTPSALQKAEMSTAAMTLLSNPELNVQVRATAAWALGMLRVNSQISKYNFPLVASTIGSLACEIGEKTNASIAFAPKKKPKVAAKKDEKAKAKAEPKAKEEDDDDDDTPPAIQNHSLAERYASLLAKEIYQSLNGMEGANESGLVKVPANQLGTSASFIRQVADLEAAVAKSAVDLVSAAPGQVDDAKKDLADRVAALKSFLTKNPPKDFALVPGAVFKLPNAPVAEAPPAKPEAKPAANKLKNAGAPGDR